MMAEDEVPWPLNRYKEAGIKITKIDMRKRDDGSPPTHVVAFVIGNMAILRDLNLSVEEFEAPPKEIFWAEWDGKGSFGKKDK